MQRRRKVRREYGLEEEKFTVLSVDSSQKRKKASWTSSALQQSMLGNPVCLGREAFHLEKFQTGKDEIRQALKDLPDNVRFLGMVERGA